jgi:hypothetical protein
MKAEIRILTLPNANGLLAVWMYGKGSEQLLVLGMGNFLKVEKHNLETRILKSLNRLGMMVLSERM